MIALKSRMVLSCGRFLIGVSFRPFMTDSLPKTTHLQFQCSYRPSMDGVSFGEHGRSCGQPFCVRHLIDTTLSRHGALRILKRPPITLVPYLLCRRVGKCKFLSLCSYFVNSHVRRERRALVDEKNDMSLISTARIESYAATAECRY